MPLNTILLFVCGLLLGLLLRRNGIANGTGDGHTERTGGQVSNPSVHLASSSWESMSDQDTEFAPQLRNLQTALGKAAPGKAYAAARAAGILR